MSAPDHNDWEHDPVWDLLQEADPPEAGPFFVRNVMREVRLAGESQVAWWQRLLRPKPLLAGALGAAAAVVVVANLDLGAPDAPGIADAPAPAVTPASSPGLDQLVAEEMLYQAAEDPSAFSDEALLAMLAAD